jgi:hypothetical protein
MSDNDNLVALLEAVKELLDASEQPEDISPELFALRAAYNQVMSEPDGEIEMYGGVLPRYKTWVDMNMCIPNGYSVTICEPVPIPGFDEPLLEFYLPKRVPYVDEDEALA